MQTAKINTGPFVGGYTVAKNDARLNWYFANIALLGFVDRIPADVKNYLNLYLQNTSPNFSIKDIFFTIGAKGVDFNSPKFEATGAGQFSDSDDSYAATFLSLAARYYEVTCDKAYFNSLVPGKNHTVLQALKNIATNNLVKSQWPNGLIHVFQSAPAYYIAFTQDNVEAYRMDMPQSQYTAGWALLDSMFPLYTTNAYDSDPWVLIGLAAALAGKNDLAKKMQAKAEASFQNGIVVPINNWSFHRRIALKLQTGKTY